MDKKLSESIIRKAASEMGKKGGKKSKRVLTREQSLEMIRIREERRKKYESN